METTKRPGRKRDEAWNEIDVAEDGYVYCLRCKQSIHSLGYTHVDRVKCLLREACAKRPRQQVVTSYFPPEIDIATQNAFNKIFALWLHYTGMAFYKASHDLCAAVFHVLHPIVAISSQHLLRGRLLDECNDESLTRICSALARRVFPPVTDAWPDINGFAVINYLAIFWSDTLFLETVYTRSGSHDSVFLANDINQVIEKFIDFVAVVTDNTSANQSAWAILQENVFKNVFPWVCRTHS
ncbi:hypothetical protein GN958_ATG06582 [Phytophthora infestans]|uniref:DUF659 domain-containing protein n=1 Tax=Phytophthora infestans TaxID=4787 RepID=A0A8S9UU82_PHYIN|nr:hypothetical protein GN958_ATG06582 [Phytophthora infestans]